MQQINGDLIGKTLAKQSEPSEWFLKSREGSRDGIYSKINS